MPKSVGLDPVSRKKEVVVIVIPFCSTGPQYEQYCRQKLMLHQPFRHLDELLGGLETHSQAYSAFLQSSANDIHRLEAAQRVDREDNEVNAFVAALNDCKIIFIIIIRTQEQDQDETDESDGHRIDDWMLICQHNAEFGQATGEEEDCVWSLAAIHRTAASGVCCPECIDYNCSCKSPSGKAAPSLHSCARTFRVQ